MTTLDWFGADLAASVRALPDEELLELAKTRLAEGESGGGSLAEAVAALEAAREEATEAAEAGRAKRVDVPMPPPETFDQRGARVGARLWRELLRGRWTCRTNVVVDRVRIFVLGSPNNLPHRLRPIERSVLERTSQGMAIEAVAKDLGWRDVGTAEFHLKRGLSRVGLGAPELLALLEKASQVSRRLRPPLRGTLVSDELAILALDEALIVAADPSAAPLVEAGVEPPEDTLDLLESPEAEEP
jgi:hypothetical protein